MDPSTHVPCFDRLLQCGSWPFDDLLSPNYLITSMIIVFIKLDQYCLCRLLYFVVDSNKLGLLALLGFVLLETDHIKLYCTLQKSAKKIAKANLKRGRGTAVAYCCVLLHEIYIFWSCEDTLAERWFMIYRIKRSNEKGSIVWRRRIEWKRVIRDSLKEIKAST